MLKKWYHAFVPSFISFCSRHKFIQERSEKKKFSFERIEWKCMEKLGYKKFEKWKNSFLLMQNYVCVTYILFIIPYQKKNWKSLCFINRIILAVNPHTWIFFWVNCIDVKCINLLTSKYPFSFFFFENF